MAFTSTSSGAPPPATPRRQRGWGAALVLLSVMLSALAVPQAALAQPAPDLPSAVLKALVDAQLPADALAAAALPLEHRGRPWQLQAERPMVPASTMKLVTSIVALDRLGPNSRGYTELRSAARIEPDGTLAGDLVLKGGGDVDLGIPQFWAMLMALREQGVQRIAGKLIVDRTLWRPARPDLGVPAFDEAPEFAYNVIPDALNLAGALMPIELRSDAAGRLGARSVPALFGLSLDGSAVKPSVMTPNGATTACADWDDDWQPARVQRSAAGDTVIALQGAFPRDCSARTELQLIDRAEFTERLFRTLWAQLGGRFDGRVEEAAASTTGSETRTLVRRTSRSWGELLRHLNKTSDNAHTRMLFNALGVPAMATNHQASTAALADRAVREWLQEKGIAARGLVTDNGSGLSRAERIAPLTLAEMLRANWQGPHRHDLLMSLPTAGVDGTLRNRLKGSPAAGWARLKTGTLRNANALAGVIRDAQGRPWAVAMMVNDERLAGRGRAVLDALVDAMVRGVPGEWALDPGSAPLAVGPQGDGP
jgi:serine-type D-Ala-D-Ala carboxypeptidase/endopeptidase (penicillin-binding protein 4)